MGAILSNITRKLLWFEITKMLITHTPFCTGLPGCASSRINIHPSSHTRPDHQTTAWTYSNQFEFWPRQLHQHLHPHSACHLGKCLFQSKNKFIVSFIAIFGILSFRITICCCLSVRIMSPLIEMAQNKSQLLQSSLHYMLHQCHHIVHKGKLLVSWNTAFWIE